VTPPGRNRELTRISAPGSARRILLRFAGIGSRGRERPNSPPGRDGIRTFFDFSQCTQYPFTRDTPGVVPASADRFGVFSPSAESLRTSTAVFGVDVRHLFDTNFAERPYDEFFQAFPVGSCRHGGNHQNAAVRLLGQRNVLESRILPDGRRKGVSLVLRCLVTCIGLEGDPRKIIRETTQPPKIAPVTKAVIRPAPP
jgi:hypothetical protein